MPDVTLRPLSVRDLPEMLDSRNNPEIWRWCRQFDLISESQHRRWFDAQDADPRIRMYGIEGRGNNLLGVCGLTDIDHVNQRAEFSLYVFTDSQGCGYGKAALKALCTHGFKNLNLNTIWGETFDGNPAAAMFEKIGFVLEGTRKQFYFRDGQFIDCHLYSVQRAEWKY